MKRRTVLLGGLGAVAAYAVAKKPGKHGGAHDEYFLGVQAALRAADLMRPTLVIDHTRLNQNLKTLKSHLPKSKAYRIVAKSLPALGLIREVRAATGTDRLMTFHQPHVNLLAAEMPDAKQLLGKPMPVGAAKKFFETHQPNATDVFAQIEWLVDTPGRIAEYRELAKAVGGGHRLKLNLEIDVGLHRGGFTSAQDVAEAIRAINSANGAEGATEFSGLMGYEAHAAKIPDALGGMQGALAKAWKFYTECTEAAKQELGAAWDPAKLTLNIGGSNTYESYDDNSPGNELAMGSGLVKPTDFDTKGLADHVPAAFIATPVLKALDHTWIPGIESLAGLFRTWDPNTARTFYIYGGYWLAKVESPKGLQRNDIWGHSTNQDMLNGSDEVQLAVGDHVFFRPQQSEFVFLQFGDIAVYEGGKITESWPVFPD